MARTKQDNGDEVTIQPVEAPPPGTAPHGVPAGLPPDQYMTAQEKHVAGGGDYAPPEETEEEARARLEAKTKADLADRAEPVAVQEDEPDAKKSRRTSWKKEE